MQEGHQAGPYLLLGSAALDLLRQSGETLAGRVSYLALGPIDLLEVPGDDPPERGCRDRPPPGPPRRGAVGHRGEAEPATPAGAGPISARADLEPERSFVVYPGPESFPLGDGVTAMPLRRMAERIGQGG